jgi:hypothetical protein
MTLASSSNFIPGFVGDVRICAPERAGRLGSVEARGSEFSEGRMAGAVDCAKFASLFKAIGFGLSVAYSPTHEGALKKAGVRLPIWCNGAGPG